MLPAKQFLTIALVLWAIAASAQNTYQQLLPAGNDAITTSGDRFTWSLGDVFADDVTGSQAIIISRVEENLALTHGLRLAGNPTAAITRLELTEPIAISYQIYDLTGRLLRTKDAGQSDNHLIDLGLFPAGTYLLSVYTTAGKQLMATYRVRKQ